MFQSPSNEDPMDKLRTLWFLSQVSREQQSIRGQSAELLTEKFGGEQNNTRRVASDSYQDVSHPLSLGQRRCPD